MNWNIKKKLLAASLVGSMLFGLGVGAAHAHAEQDIQSAMQSDASMKERETVQCLKDAYALQQHAEGGWFAEIYTSAFKQKGRSTAGSIYFLLDKGDISHFHQLDCDEIWYYHAGCGMKITILQDGKQRDVFRGVDTTKDEQPMVVIPAGAIFAAENMDKNSYTFISCATTPRFDYKGFRLVPRAELKKQYPALSADVLQMAYEKI